MHLYICEKNIIGFLTAVFYAYYNKERVDKILSCRESVLLGDTFKTIEANRLLAERVRDGIKKRIGNGGWEAVRLAYAAEVLDKEDIIFQFLRLVFKHGRAAQDMHADPAVSRFNEIVQRVAHEAHILRGFLRFQELSNGGFFSSFSSDHNVLEFLAPHFADRFNTHKFMILDMKRNLAMCYDGERYLIIPVSGEVTLELSAREEAIASLWKQYHKALSIESRENKKLQKRFVPSRYRWFMNEFR